MVVRRDCRDPQDHRGEAVALCTREERRARVVARCVRQRGVVEQQLGQVERVLIGGDALVLHVGPTVRRTEVAVLDVERDVEEQQVEDGRRALHEHRVVDPLDDREQCVRRLLVVDVRVPLGETEARLLGEPIVDEAAGARLVPGTGVAVAAEPVVRERLPGEVLVGVEEQAVVLGPVVALVDGAGRLRVREPVLERPHVLLHRGAHVGREEIAVAVPEVHHVREVEVGGVDEVVHALERTRVVRQRDPAGVERRVSAPGPLRVVDHVRVRAGRERLARVVQVAALLIAPPRRRHESVGAARAGRIRGDQRPTTCHHHGDEQQRGQRLAHRSLPRNRGSVTRGARCSQCGSSNDRRMRSLPNARFASAQRLGTVARCHPCALSSSPDPRARAPPCSA